MDTWVQVAMILAPAAAALLSALAAWFSAKARQIAGQAKTEATAAKTEAKAAKTEAEAAKTVGQDNAVSLSNTQAALAGNTATTEATHAVVNGRYDALLAKIAQLETQVKELKQGKADGA